MTRLTIFDENGRQASSTKDAHAIAAALAEIGVRFERWPLSGYGPHIGSLIAAGYSTTDTVSVTPDHPERESMRAKFLSEHRHDEDEIRFFLDGAGLFTLREGDRVFAVLCEAGDMISVPAGMRHWFDMGQAPRFTAMRFFRTADGWVGKFTGDPISDRFPRLESA